MSLHTFSAFSKQFKTKENRKLTQSAFCLKFIWFFIGQPKNEERVKANELKQFLKVTVQGEMEEMN